MKTAAAAALLFFPGFEPDPVLPEPTAEDDDFYTPRWFLAWLPPVALDPCGAEKAHVQAGRVLDLRRGEDGLALPWNAPALTFCNPPYSACSAWVARCHDQARMGVVAALIPAKPGEAYWHEHIWGSAHSVGFLRGRIKFDTVNGPAKDAATFGSALVVWGSQWSAGKFVQHVNQAAGDDVRRPHWVSARAAGRS